MDLHQLGMTPDVQQKFVDALDSDNGMIVVAGPRGSGKSTTINAGVEEANPRRRLDEDLFIFEIRDDATALAAVRKALEGNLVLADIESTTTDAAINKLIRFCVSPLLVTSAVKAVLAQVLVPTICTICRKPYNPTAEELTPFGTTTAEVADITFIKGFGCDECNDTGFRGHIGLFELMPITRAIRDLLTRPAWTPGDLREMAVQEGMYVLQQDLFLKVCVGITTLGVYRPDLTDS